MTVIMPLVPDQISERNYRPQTKSEASGNHGLAGQAKEEVPRVLPLAMPFFCVSLSIFLQREGVNKGQLRNTCLYQLDPDLL